MTSIHSSMLQTCYHPFHCELPTKRFLSSRLHKEAAYPCGKENGQRSLSEGRHFGFDLQERLEVQTISFNFQQIN